MYIHTYLLYDSLRNKDIVKIKSEHSAPCTQRDAEEIYQKTIFLTHEIAFVGIVKTEEEEIAGQSTAADNSGNQRPADNSIKTYITWI